MRCVFAFLLTVCLTAHGETLLPCDKTVRFAADWFPDPELDLTKSAAALTAIGSAVKRTGHQIGHVIVETKVSVGPQASCTGFAVRLEFIKPVLRVASEFAPESCAYARVLNHEYTHVRIYRDMARQFRELEYPWPKDAKPNEILAYANLQLARLMRAQDEFDSPQEYAKNLTVCGGEIVRLVKVQSPASASPSPGAKRS